MNETLEPWEIGLATAYVRPVPCKDTPLSPLSHIAISNKGMHAVVLKMSAFFLSRPRKDKG